MRLRECMRSTMACWRRLSVIVLLILGKFALVHLILTMSEARPDSDGIIIYYTRPGYTALGAPKHLYRG